MTNRKPAPCRQLKVMCRVHGYIARVTRMWLDKAGAPLCPTCRKPMTEEVRR